MWPNDDPILDEAVEEAKAFLAACQERIDADTKWLRDYNDVILKEQAGDGSK